MTDANRKPAPSPSRFPGRPVIVERTFRASPAELWEMWTTPDGFESWWPPDGFRTKVHHLEARLHGTLLYDMIAEAPEVLATLKRLGVPPSHLERARFAEFAPHTRLVLVILMDFLPRVEPYDNTIEVDFLPGADHVRLVLTVHPMHDPEFTRLAAQALGEQLRNLDNQLKRPKP